MKTDLVPDMSIEITVHEFHEIHHSAEDIKERLKDNVSDWSVADLTEALKKLEAAQALSDAETGSDAHWAPSYRDSIELAEKLLAERVEREALALKVQVLNREYADYVADLKADWISKHRKTRQFGWENVYETMSEHERKEVHDQIAQWQRYITPLAEAWWKERGFGCIWPENDSDNMKIYKLEEE